MMGVMRRMMATGPDRATTMRRKARNTMLGWADRAGNDVGEASEWEEEGKTKHA